MPSWPLISRVLSHRGRKLNLSSSVQIPCKNYGCMQHCKTPAFDTEENPWGCTPAAPVPSTKNGIHSSQLPSQGRMNLPSVPGAEVS
ncbi:hypothetical protein Y1Q_0002884 [Alligator mississippiensis]|uniref:Uncharacterized protein n=1 Tax=Alligator mississippiensis TaxID=8496 RepID=A0A151MCP4_ALLMI|nr:hypothetical protein Y1Q_0002884 [Alligator mississippiensis]